MLSSGGIYLTVILSEAKDQRKAISFAQTSLASARVAFTN